MKNNKKNVKKVYVNMKYSVHWYQRPPPPPPPSETSLLKRGHS